MKTYWKLFRAGNLLIMALILVLTRYALFLPVYIHAGIALQMPGIDFIILIITTLFIAAGGNVVNDILDISIDNLNKPSENQVGRAISEKKAWNIYYILNIAGILAGTYISWRAGYIQLGIIFLVIATVLYYYSLKYKYLPFWGNFSISVLAAFVILTYYLLEFFYLRNNSFAFTDMIPWFPALNLRVFLYAGFAFYITFIREMSKDTQDIDGDRKMGCRTIPVIIGIRKSRNLIFVLTVTFMLGLAYLQYLAFISGFNWFAIYMFIVQFMMAYVSYRLLISENSTDFALVSRLFKLTMSAGILSMIFANIPS